MNPSIDKNLTFKAGIITLARFLNSFSNLIIFIILSRYLTQNDYGAYREIWLLYNTFAPLIILGLPESINYFFPRLNSQEQKSFNNQTFLILMFMGFIFTALLFLLSPLIAVWLKNPNLTSIIRLFSLIPLLTLPTLYYQNLFICLNRARSAALLGIACTAFRLVAIVIPIILSFGLYSIFFSLVMFSSLQFFAVIYFQFKPFFGISRKPGRISVGSQLKFSVPIGLSTLIGTLTLQIDKFFIVAFFTAGQYAVYVNGAQEVPLIAVLTGSVAAVLMPEFVKYFSKDDSGKMIHVWHNSIRKIALIVFPIMFFLLVFAREFLIILFSQKYIASTGIFRIYLFTLPMRITTFGTVLLAMGLSSLILRYSLYTVLINAGANFLLIHLIGFKGPAIATVFAIYLIGYLQLRKISAQTKIDFSKILPWNFIARISGSCAVIGMVTFLFREFSPDGWGVWKIGLGGFLFIGIFLPIGLLLKFITTKDLKIPLWFIRNILKSGS